jgi:hypothetical protein
LLEPLPYSQPDRIVRLESIWDSRPLPKPLVRHPAASGAWSWRRVPG